MKIRFRSINAIEEFLDIVNSFSAEIDIKSKRTTVDGKSMRAGIWGNKQICGVGYIYEAISKYAA